MNADQADKRRFPSPFATKLELSYLPVEIRSIRVLFLLAVHLPICAELYPQELQPLRWSGLPCGAAV